jgi:hypothetical protein
MNLPIAVSHRYICISIFRAACRLSLLDITTTNSVSLVPGSVSRNHWCVHTIFFIALPPVSAEFPIPKRAIRNPCRQFKRCLEQN